ncbi:hypothetical protein FORC098_0557 [Salmonella enterica subsp. enterica serovar Typhimurium]|nr:hypothetical protein FORC098_0557 [Salmonella enterica subsp. enterica serovar Typhimurium]
MPLNIHHMNDKSKKRTKCQIFQPIDFILFFKEQRRKTAILIP